MTANLNEEYKNKIFTACNSLAKYTCQILYDGDYKAQGTGVLITDNEQFFLVSAAHVVENKLSSLYVRNGEKTIFQLHLESNINKVENRKSDKIDVAVLKLTPSTVEELSKYHYFLEIRQLGVNHIVSRDGSYVTYGYPASQTKKHYTTGTIIAEPTFIVMKAVTDEKVYNDLICVSTRNIIAEYPRNKMRKNDTEVIGTGPDLAGMSGGGFWNLHYDIDKNIDKKLVGILTEWSLKNRNYVIYTRIDIISEILRNLYDVNISPSQIFSSTFSIEE